MSVSEKTSAPVEGFVTGMWHVCECEDGVQQALLRASKRLQMSSTVGLLKGLKTALLKGLETAPDELHGSEPFSTGQLREVLEF